MLKKQPEAQGRPGETRAGNRTENRISLVLNVLKSRKTWDEEKPLDVATWRMLRVSSKLFYRVMEIQATWLEHKGRRFHGKGSIWNEYVITALNFQLHQAFPRRVLKVIVTNSISSFIQFIGHFWKHLRASLQVLVFPMLMCEAYASRGAPCLHPGNARRIHLWEETLFLGGQGGNSWMELVVMQI